MNRLSYNEAAEQWTWVRATFDHWTAMAELSITNYEEDVEDIFQTNHGRVYQQLGLTLVNQMFEPGSHYLSVAIHKTTREIVAYNWINRGEWTDWSTEEMANQRMVHIKKSLPTATRIRLCYQMIEQLEAWASLHRIPIVISTTVRANQDAFLRLFERSGFTLRGVLAYKRLTTEPSTGQLKSLTK
jgi:hypothetical protein